MSLIINIFSKSSKRVSVSEKTPLGKKYRTKISPKSTFPLSRAESFVPFCGSDFLSYSGFYCVLGGQKKSWGPRLWPLKLKSMMVTDAGNIFNFEIWVGPPHLAGPSSFEPFYIVKSWFLAIFRCNFKALLVGLVSSGVWHMNTWPVNSLQKKILHSKKILKLLRFWATAHFLKSQNWVMQIWYVIIGAS